MPTPPVFWTLKLGDLTRPLAAWNISNPQTRFSSLDADQLTFDVAGDVLTACPFAYGAEVKLFRDDVCVFIGTVTSVRARATSKTAGWLVTTANVWFQFARTLYQQPMVAWAGEAGCAKSTITTTKLVLFSDEITGTSITTGEQLQAIMNFAIAQTIPVALGVRPAFVNAAFEEARDLTIAEAIRRCLAPTPDAVSWCDYSSGVTTINFQQRAFLDSAALDLESVPRLVTDFELEERKDMVPVGVRFDFIGVKLCPPEPPATCASPGDTTVQVTTISRQEAGLPNLPGGIIAAVDLVQLSESVTEPAPLGFAAAYYASLLVPHYQGYVTTKEKSCAATLRPGKVLNLTNGLTAWNGMNAVIQEVTEDLNLGVTKATLGPPQHLGPQDFITALQLARKNVTKSAFPATRPPGNEATPNCVAGYDPDGLKALNKAKGNGGAMAAAIDGGSTGDERNFGARLPTTDLEICPDGTKTVYAPTP